MNKRQDLREKVKEIKQRQQNWMKQRAETQGNPDKDTGKPGNDAVHSKSKALANTQHSVKNKQHSVPEYNRRAESNSQFLAHSLVSSNKSNAKFQSWLKMKQTKNENSEEQDTEQNHRVKEDSVYNSTKYTDNYYTDKPYRDHKGSGSVNVLKVQSSRSPEFATPDPSWNSDDETGEITATQQLSADDFDARADDIIARVKGDLSQTKTDYSRRSHSDQKNTIARSAILEQQVPEEQELSSHVCPTCDKLMMPPDASPMLLIPCGHTLCNSCRKRTKYCAMCGCVVQSSTLNIMLQQIITNFHTKQTRRQAAQKTAPLKRVKKLYLVDADIPVPKRTLYRWKSSKETKGPAMPDFATQEFLPSECPASDTSLTTDGPFQSDISVVDEELSDISVDSDTTSNGSDSSANSTSSDTYDNSITDSTHVNALKILSCFQKHKLTASACKDILKTIKRVSTSDSQSLYDYNHLLSFVPSSSYKEVHYCAKCNRTFPDDKAVYRCLTENCPGLRYVGDLSQQEDSNQAVKYFMVADVKTLLSNLLKSPVQKNNYREEYQNLITRQEILQEESENISKNIQKITKKLDQDQQLVANIQGKEDDLESQIEGLQRKLRELTEHRLEYEKTCYTLEIQVKEEKNRLALVQDSLTSVEQQIEKVNLLVENDF